MQRFLANRHYSALSGILALRTVRLVRLLSDAERADRTDGADCIVQEVRRNTTAPVPYRIADLDPTIIGPG